MNGSLEKKIHRPYKTGISVLPFLESLRHAVMMVLRYNNRLSDGLNSLSTEFLTWNLPVDNRPLVKECVPKKLISYFSTKTNFVGTQKPSQ